jgi:hypothetical protein
MVAFLIGLLIGFVLGILCSKWIYNMLAKFKKASKDLTQ